MLAFLLACVAAKPVPPTVSIAAPNPGLRTELLSEGRLSDRLAKPDGAYVKTDMDAEMTGLTTLTGYELSTGFSIGVHLSEETDPWRLYEFGVIDEYLSDAGFDALMESLKLKYYEPENVPAPPVEGEAPVVVAPEAAIARTFLVPTQPSADPALLTTLMESSDSPTNVTMTYQTHSQWWSMFSTDGYRNAALLHGRRWPARFTLLKLTRDPRRA